MSAEVERTSAAAQALAPTRKCGVCAECCVHLGIEDLKKYAGHACVHLSADSTSARRCSIYTQRPAACSAFLCGYIAGIGHEITGRPDRSGMLISFYQLTPENTNAAFDPRAPFSATIIIIDPRRCGTISSGKLHDALEQILAIGINDVKIVNHKTQGVVHLHQGLIRQGTLLPQRSYEDLTFMVEDEIIGNYHTQEPSDA